MCTTTIANLMWKTVKDGKPRHFFSKDKEIIPFIESYWESITTSARKPTTGTIIQKALQSNPSLFTCQDNGGDLMFALIEKNLEIIKPTYESLKTNQKEDGKQAT